MLQWDIYIPHNAGVTFFYKSWEMSSWPKTSCGGTKLPPSSKMLRLVICLDQRVAVVFKLY